MSALRLPLVVVALLLGAASARADDPPPPDELGDSATAPVVGSSSTAMPASAVDAPAVSAPGASDAPHGDPSAHATTAALAPSDVVRRLHEAARAGDIGAFRAELSARFVRDVERLELAAGARGEAGHYAWPALMSALASEDLVALDENFFYERASVRATTASDRVLFFRLVLEEGRWKIDLPRDLERAAQTLDERSAVATTSVSTTSADTPLVVAPPPDVVPVVETEPGFFDPGSVGHYAWYLPDYAFIAASATMLVFDVWTAIPPLTVAMGPSFNLARPDGPSLFDPRIDGVIGHPYLQEKVPPWGLAAVGASAVMSLAVVDVVRHLEFHHTHAFVVGALTSTMLASVLTETTKLAVGRLRPDFRDRYSRAACAGYVEGVSELDCDSVRADGFVLTQRDVIDGMKSFPSSHASTAFALATYLSLYLGGEWVWGKDTAALAMPVATLAMGLLGAAASFVAASRVADNRHHLEDVVVGAGIGMASGAAGYFIHFDTDGDARWRTFELTPLAIPGAASGLGLRARF